MKRETYTIKKIDEDYLKMAVQAASRAFGVDSEDILGKSRVQPLVFARMTSYWLLSVGKGYSYSKTGRMFDRDHAAIMNGIKRVELELELGEESKNINGNWAGTAKQAYEFFLRFHKVYIESDVYRVQKETNYVIQPS